MPKAAKAKACPQCSRKDFLEIFSSCKDASTWSYKGNEKDGYLPKLSGITPGEEIIMSVCVNCGRLRDFDKKQMAKDLEKAFDNSDEED